MKMLNHNIGVIVDQPKDSVVKQGSLFIITDSITEDYQTAEVVYPDKKGEFKKGDRLAFVGGGTSYNDVLIIQKHQILFIDAE